MEPKATEDNQELEELQTNARQQLLEDEPELNVDDIQGDSILGFNKPFQIVTLARIVNNERETVQQVKDWLRDNIRPNVSSTRNVIEAREIHRRQGEDPNALTNISFTFDGLQILLANTDLEPDLNKFGPLNPFRIGAEKRSTLLGDPVSGQGSVGEWQFGNKEMEVHIQVNIAANTQEIAEEKWNTIFEEKEMEECLKIVRKDTGSRGNENGDFYGHEHFGFKDGLSQPVVRGTYIRQDGQKDFVARRTLAESDPHYKDFAKPGFNLVDPSEFVSGIERGKSTELDLIDWLAGSSYVVYRKFFQNVPLFWETALDEAHDLHNNGRLNDSTWENEKNLAGLIASKRIGRWWDGTPLFWPPISGKYYPPNPDAGEVHRQARDGLLNGFFFDEGKNTWTLRTGQIIPTPRKYEADSKGAFCPMAGHIRKMNARDMATDIGPASETLRKRILRRSITYGPRLKDVFAKDEEDRGLLFNMYMSDIEEQFEFLQRQWANSANKPFEGGNDMVIGETPTKERSLKMMLPDGEYTSEQTRYFVIPIGMVYMLTVPISAIDKIARSVAGLPPLPLYMPPANQRDFAYQSSYVKWDEFVQSMFQDTVWGPMSAARSTGMGKANYPNGIAYRLPGWQDPSTSRNVQFKDPKRLARDSQMIKRRIAEPKISWTGFPRRITNLFRGSPNPQDKYEYAERLGWPPKDFRSNRYGSKKYPKARQMDEYCEWFTRKDDKTGKIVSVDITCEGPEYWSQMVMGPERETALALYRKYTSPDVQVDDLLDADGKYNPYNKWNTTHGIMHLNCPPNSLAAEVYIAGEASTRWRNDVNGPDLTSAQDLIECGDYGLKTRASDPTIGAAVNALIRSDEKLVVSLKNPVGLYLEDLNMTGWQDPNGDPLDESEVVTYQRGSEEYGRLRVHIEVPPEKGYTLGDCFIGGAPILWAGQIVESSVTVFLKGIGLPTKGTDILGEHVLQTFALAKKKWEGNEGVPGVPPHQEQIQVFPPPVEDVWRTYVLM